MTPSPLLKVTTALLLTLAISACGGGGSGSSSSNGNDTVAPVIDITGGLEDGDSLPSINIGDSFTAPSASATDNIDGSVSVSIDTSNVDINNAGTYSVIYTATDAAGNTATIQLSLNVAATGADITPPVINITGGYNDGDTLPPIDVGQSFTAPAASATDNIDGTVAVDINSSAVNTTIAGRYDVIYTATDSANNPTTITLSLLVRDLVSGATNESIYWVQGNSLFSHTDGSESYVSDYTQTGEWLGVLAAHNGWVSSGALKFGFTPAANDLNWSNASNIDYNVEFSVNNTTPFDPDNNNLANDPLTHIYFMPSNFLGEEMGQFPFTNTAAYQAVAQEFIDNVNGLFPNTEILLYIHWPDAGPLGGENMSRAEFTTYNNATMNEYLSWHNTLEDAILASGRSLRSIPVGPIIAWLFENESYLQGLQFNQVYGDDAPHGSETIYFLAALISAQVVYRQPVDLTGFSFPSGTIVRAEVINNLEAINQAISERLAFYNESLNIF